jgi:hypothetical protein
MRLAIWRDSVSRPKNGPRGRASITKTERPRAANLLQMPRGLMCKLRRRGRDYGGRAGSREIDPSLQPLPICSNCWGRPLWTGGIPDDPKVKSQFRPRPSGLQHWYCAVRGPVLHLRVPYFRPTFTAGELSGRPYFGLCAALKALSIAFVASKIAYCSVGDMPVVV